MPKSSSNPNPQTIGRDVFAEPCYVWLFQCLSKPALHAASLSRGGEGIPRDVCRGGKWVTAGQLIVGPDANHSVGIDIQALKAGIKQDGFYLWTADAEPWPDNLILMR
jgi:hypothetical protein